MMKIEQGSLFYITEQPDIYYYFAMIDEKTDLLIYATINKNIKSLDIQKLSNKKFQDILRDKKIVKIEDKEWISTSNKMIIKKLFMGWLF